ncbi:MAG: GTPase HflX [Actinomycetota bacterium]|nr:GTPase HflX [Actinomycetota bacterium]
MAKPASNRAKQPKRDVLESPLSATWQRRQRERAVLVGVGRGIDESCLDELAALADTAGAEPVARVVQSRSGPDPATFVGKGKIAEIHDAVHRSGADTVVLDDELSAGQLRNLEERLGTKVIDRTALILDIFALHARSREGKAQVELAQLNYLLPRLRGWGEAMSRLGAGIGTRGPGETKLEVDRQHIKRRITRLRRDIKDLARTRSVKRSQRESSGVPQVAIAGYTNAGKSTLMNALTEAHVLVADQLFATLDPTTRRITLPGGRNATLSDTVGFVGKLPHDLVEAFRSTLEEVTLAALIVHVADAASREVEDQVRAVRGVLADIGAGDIPEVLALNKADVLSEEDARRVAGRFPDAVVISASTGAGVEGLVERIAVALPSPPIEVTVLVPYGREEVVAGVYRTGEVLDSEETEEGTRLHARIQERELARVRDFIVYPVRREVARERSG